MFIYFSLSFIFLFRCFFNFFFFLLLFLRAPENPPKISVAGIINYILKESRNRLAADRAETVPESPTRPSYKHNTYFIQNSKHPSPSCRKSRRDTEYCTKRTITVCTTKAQWAEKKQFFFSLLTRVEWGRWRDVVIIKWKIDIIDDTVRFLALASFSFFKIWVDIITNVINS